MERHFDEELKELKEKLLEMASLAEESNALAIKSLVDRDEPLALKVLKADRRIDKMEIEIDEHCLAILGLKQPVARDLRFVTSAMKINNELERIGDLSVNIAERAIDLLKEPPLKPLIDIPRMAELAQNMVKDSLDAFVRLDAELAREVCRRDDAVDQLNDQIFRELLIYMMEDPKSISRAVDLILVGRHLERIADHATNISEEVVFMVQGRTIKHHFEEGD